jgi:GT2 family glycosyltransferase
MVNYIITIHNSDAHLDRVLTSVFNIKSPGSRVYAVLDGCTDSSKKIAESYAVNIIETNNVRETLAINAALKVVPQDGYNFILQDDVMLLDAETEKKINHMYGLYPKLGVVGFRHGCNFEKDALTNNKDSSETDLVQNAWQPNVNPNANIEMLKNGHITFRHVVYKSPICISSEVVEKLGGYDERFAPIAHDDTEYCIRAMKAGFKNAVVSLHVDQPMDWGGTRRFKNNLSNLSEMHRVHMNLIRELYPEDLHKYGAEEKNLSKTKIW